MNDFAPDGPSSETIDVLNRRVSVRKFSPEPVPEALVDEILRAAFRAPTSSNIQTYSVLKVRDPEARRRLAEVAGGQQHIIECPVYLAFCADLTRVEYAMARNGRSLDNNNFEMGLVSSIDAALVGMSAYVAADSVGLKGVLIGALRNDPKTTAEILGLPRRVYAVFGMCLGYPAEAPIQKPRMDFGCVVHEERYDSAKMQAFVDQYDEALAHHYRSEGRKTTDDSWTHDMDAKFSVRPRDTLRETLRELGYDFA